jgi:hypothetical protein
VRYCYRALALSCYFGLQSFLVASCGGSVGTSAPTVSLGVPRFAVVVTDGHWFEPVSGLTPTLGYAGAYAIGLDGMSAAVMAADRIAVVRPHEPAVIADCADCSGIAATDKYIVTTKKNFRPGEGFDIVLFSRSLTSSRTVPTQRLEERATTAYPAENTDSPITFAADPNKITVGYLSRSGGDRRGTLDSCPVYLRWPTDACNNG